jgi:TolA-binding protein
VVSPQPAAAEAAEYNDDHHHPMLSIFQALADAIGASASSHAELETTRGDLGRAMEAAEAQVVAQLESEKKLISGCLAVLNEKKKKIRELVGEIANLTQQLEQEREAKARMMRRIQKKKKKNNSGNTAEGVETDDEEEGSSDDDGSGYSESISPPRRPDAAAAPSGNSSSTNTNTTTPAKSCQRGAAPPDADNREVDGDAHSRPAVAAASAGMEARTCAAEGRVGAGGGRGWRQRRVPAGSEDDTTGGWWCRPTDMCDVDVEDGEDALGRADSDQKDASDRKRPRSSMEDLLNL